MVAPVLTGLVVGQISYIMVFRQLGLYIQERDSGHLQDHPKV